ncbi:MAG: Flp pilus assembly protein CpaB [Desulfovermiculus sp.]
MKKTRFFQLGLVLVLALGAGFLNYQWINGKISSLGPQAEAKETTTSVVVAAKDLPVGTKLGPEMLKPVKYLPDSAPSRHFSDPQKVQGRILIAAVSANEPILESRLAPTEITVGGVQAMITPGKRAVAVKGNEVMGLSGFVAPGNKVDVMVTLRNGNGDEAATKMVLESVPVLATGTILEPSKDGSGTSPVDVYTLELTPNESEILALAANQGTLHFAMRNLQDKEPVLTRGADVKKALASLTPEAPKAKQLKPRPVKYVEIISGSTATKMKF